MYFAFLARCFTQEIQVVIEGRSGQCQIKVTSLGILDSVGLGSIV